MEYSDPRGKTDGKPNKSTAYSYSQKKLRMDDQKVECSQLPCLISRPETDFGPAALKDMPDIHQELKEEEKLNLGSYMGQLNM